MLFVALRGLEICPSLIFSSEENYSGAFWTMYQLYTHPGNKCGEVSTAREP